MNSGSEWCSRVLFGTSNWRIRIRVLRGNLHLPPDFSELESAIVMELGAGAGWK